MRKYKLLEHTADLGIQVFGADHKELFLVSASAMYDLITEVSSVNPSVSVEIKIEAQDEDELLRNWLAELLYCYHVKDLLFSEFIIEKLDKNNILSIAKGEKIDPQRHNLKREIKAVTFHNLKITQECDSLTTQIIFDV